MRYKCARCGLVVTVYGDPLPAGSTCDRSVGATTAGDRMHCGGELRAMKGEPEQLSRSAQLSLILSGHV